MSCVRVLKGLKAHCQRKRQSPFSPTKHSHFHTTSLGDLVVTQWRDAGNMTWPEASWPDKPVHQMIRRADARKELRFCIPDLSHLYLHGLFFLLSRLDIESSCVHTAMLGSCQWTVCPQHSCDTKVHPEAVCRAVTGTTVPNGYL